MKKKSITSLIVLTIIGIYLIVPLIAIFGYSCFSEWKGIFPQGFTLKFYTNLFSNSDFIPLIINSLVLALASVFICMTVLLFTLYTVIVYFPRLEKYVQMLCMIPYTIQGIILATSLLTLYSDAPGILSNRIFLLICAYCIIILPYMYQGMRNSLHAVAVKQILESAEILGASKLYAFWVIIVPNILSGITVSFLLSVGIVFGDFAIIKILASSYIKTLTVYMSQTTNMSGHETSAIVIITFTVMALLAVIALANKSRKQTAHIEEE